MLAYLKCPYFNLFLKRGLNEVAGGFPLVCSSKWRIGVHEIFFISEVGGEIQRALLIKW